MTEPNSRDAGGDFPRSGGSNGDDVGQRDRLDRDRDRENPPGASGRPQAPDSAEYDWNDELVDYQWTDWKGWTSKPTCSILVDCPRQLIEFQNCHVIRGFLLTREERYSCHVDRIRGMSHNPQMPATSSITLYTDRGEVLIECNGDPAEYLRLRRWLMASVANVRRVLISRADVWRSCLLAGPLAGLFLSVFTWLLGNPDAGDPGMVLICGAILGAALGALVAGALVMSGIIVNLPDSVQSRPERTDGAASADGAATPTRSESRNGGQPDRDLA